MKKLALSLALLALAFPVLHASPAQALNIRSWVSSNGSGSVCSRQAPCQDFQAALLATNPAGEINCADQGDFLYGTLTISKSITIDCEGVQGRVEGAGAPAFIINAAPTDVVILRGLDISGQSASPVGIHFVAGSALRIEKCVIHDITGFNGGAALLFESPNSSTAMELYVSDTVIINNDGGSQAAGILVRPTAANTINKIILNRVEAVHNKFGIKADGTLAQGGVINMTVRDSVASGNELNGIVATTNGGGAAIVMVVDHSTSSHNGAGYGVVADGPKTRIDLRHSTASGNNFGIGASNGGQLISFQDNLVELNSTDGSPTGVASFK